MRPRPSLVPLVAVLAVLGSGCGGDGDRDVAGDDTGRATSTTEVTAAAEGGAGADRPRSTGGDDACAPGPDRTITELDDTVIPALEIPEVRVAAQEVAGTTVPASTIPAATVPEQVVDGGCVIEYDAPGGCLGAVEISAFEIPGTTIPGTEIPAVTVGDDTAGAQVIEPVEIEAVRVEGDRVEQVCQQEPTDGGRYVASIYRPGLYRPAGYRPAGYRPGGYRPGVCHESDCLPSLSVPSVSLSSVSVSSESVSSATISSRWLDEGGTEVVEEDDRNSYVAPADVLFDFDEAELGSDAVPTLEAIAAEIDGVSDTAEVSVEGHTDVVGDDDYNQRLSEQRAEAVAGWLAGDGGIDADRITTAGFGASAPVASNDDDDGRARNRRVVISVATD